MRKDSISSDFNDDETTSVGYLADTSRNNSSAELAHNGWQSNAIGSYSFPISQTMTLNLDVSTVDNSSRPSSFVADNDSVHTMPTSVQSVSSGDLLYPQTQFDEASSSIIPQTVQADGTVVQPNETGDAAAAANGAAEQQPPVKKVKMHQCTICEKFFPRPSGLATHMNSHSGARRKSSQVTR